MRSRTVGFSVAFVVTKLHRSRGIVFAIGDRRSTHVAGRQRFTIYVPDRVSDTAIRPRW